MLGTICVVEIMTIRSTCTTEQLNLIQLREFYFLLI